MKGFPGGSDSKESASDVEDAGSIPGWEDALEKGKATHSSILAWVKKSQTWLSDFHFHLGIPGGSAGKESACNAEDLGWTPGLGRSPGEREGYPLQYSGLENSMDCIVHGIAKSLTRLSNFHFYFCYVPGT